jgi:hypothetical protein
VQRQSQLREREWLLERPDGVLIVADQTNYLANLVLARRRRIYL